MITDKLLLRIFLLTIMAFISAASSADDSDVDAIRSVRFLSNAAIEHRNLEMLEGTWLPDAQVTSSTGQVASGSKEMAQMFADSFADPDYINYTRYPVGVTLSPGKTFAAESGTWEGRWKSGDGEMLIEGIYLAQWRKVDAGWRIRSELYVALSCEGSGKCEDLP